MKRRRALEAVGVALPLLIAFSRAPERTTPGTTPLREDPTRSTDLRRAGGELRAGLARVAERHQGVGVLVPARNPFAFSTPPETAPQPVATAPPAGAAPAVLEPQVLQPSLTLIGIAANQVQGRAERFAMIAVGEDTLHFVREGETLGARYRVQRIGEADVQLADLTTAAGRHLSLLH